MGAADSNVTINIEDCERIRIDTISGTPHVNLYRSCLYYDYTILDRLAQDTIEDMRLWYVMRKSTDPRLTVDYMTVREYDTPTISSGTDFYDTSTPNDNHFLDALCLFVMILHQTCKRENSSLVTLMLFRRVVH